MDQNHCRSKILSPEGFRKLNLALANLILQVYCIFVVRKSFQNNSVKAITSPSPLKIVLVLIAEVGLVFRSKPLSLSQATELKLLIQLSNPKQHPKKLISQIKSVRTTIESRRYAKRRTKKERNNS